MKKALFFVSVALLALAGCATVSRGADLVGGVSGRTGGSTAAVMAGPADFRADEVLCAESGDPDVLDNAYRVAKVLTPASPATKNQAEVVFVDGKKAWTNFVIPTRKAGNADLKVGSPILYSQWGASELSADDYRQGRWHFGNVTALDELFKGVVEIKGDKILVKNCRVPTQPIQ